MATDTTAPPAYLDSSPWIREAVATAEPPASWQDGDEPEVLQTIETLCAWLGPFLPKPEMVATAARDLAGEEADSLSRLEHRPPSEIHADLYLLIQYLAMVGAAIEALTEMEA